MKYIGGVSCMSKRFQTKLAGDGQRQYDELFRRYEDNPILSSHDWPYPVNTVFNPAATMIDGKVLLLARVEDRRGISHLTKAVSADGYRNWKIDEEPTLEPDPEHFPEDKWGIEDPRITYLPELKEYAVTFTSYSGGGPLVSLALTKDFHHSSALVRSRRRMTRMQRCSRGASRGNGGSSIAR